MKRSHKVQKEIDNWKMNSTLLLTSHLCYGMWLDSFDKDPKSKMTKELKLLAISSAEFEWPGSAVMFDGEEMIVEHLDGRIKRFSRKDLVPPPYVSQDHL